MKNGTNNAILKDILYLEREEGENNYETDRRLCSKYSGFSEPGIIFRDVTSVLQDAEGLHLAIDLMQEKLEGLDFDVVVGPESRGFIFGVPIAYNLKKPFIPIRKKESFQERRFLQSMN